MFLRLNVSASVYKFRKRRNTHVEACIYVCYTDTRMFHIMAIVSFGPGEMLGRGQKRSGIFIQ